MTTGLRSRRSAVVRLRPAASGMLKTGKSSGSPARTSALRGCPDPRRICWDPSDNIPATRLTWSTRLRMASASAKDRSRPAMPAWRRSECLWNTPSSRAPPMSSIPLGQGCGSRPGNGTEYDHAEDRRRHRQQGHQGAEPVGARLAPGHPTHLGGQGRAHGRACVRAARRTFSPPCRPLTISTCWSSCAPVFTDGSRNAPAGQTRPRPSIWTAPAGWPRWEAAERHA